MSNLININNIISSLNISDIKQTITLDNISTELSKAISNNKYGMLEVLANSEGLEFFLQIDETSFAVDIKNKLNIPLVMGEKVTIPIKINSSGVMILDVPKQNHVTSPLKNEVIIETKEALINKPTLTPIKLQSFVDENIKDIPLDNKTRQQIIQIAKDIEVSIAKIGSMPEKSVDIDNLQKTIREIISAPQKINILKPQLEEIIKSFDGKQLGGEIINKINRLYVVKTPLGDTCFSSEINIPLAEKITMDIKIPPATFEQKIKIVDEVLKHILPNYKSTSNIESLLKDTSFHQLVDFVRNYDAKITARIMQKFPLQSNNLFENIYNLYKGAINNDITQWLGAETIKELLSDSQTGQKLVSELNNMMRSSVKETPTWRIVEMPFYDGSQLSSLKIALKKDKQQEKNKKDRKTTRFVVETEFSKLGKFQFDGFSKAQSRSLDLVIRTSNKISDDFCANIINLFKKSLYDLDYSGSIRINVSESFIKLQEDNTINKGVYI